MSKFNPAAKGYSSLNALWLGKAARLAMQDREKVIQRSQEWGFDRVYRFEQADVQGFLIANPQVVVLAFADTPSTHLQDWLTASQISLVPGPMGHVHQGFLTALDNLWDDLMLQLIEAWDHQQGLLITGHGVGGALATLATARLRQAQQPVSALYTFGSPRVGDKTFADPFDEDCKARTFRLVNHHDRVSRVVPRAYGYSHVGRCLYFDQHGTLQTSIRYWNRFLDSLQGKLEDFLTPDLETCREHTMALYEAHLLQNIEFSALQAA